MSEGALEGMMGIIPLAIAGGIAVGVTERMLGPTGPRGRRQRKPAGFGFAPPKGVDTYRKPPKGYDAYHRPSRKARKPKESSGSSFYANEFANSPAFRAGASMRRGSGPSSLKRRFANPY